MSKRFYDRLRDYYQEVAQLLRGESRAASVYPNATDIGQSRERAYRDFLRQHVPQKCTVTFGGYLFHVDGSESKQVDVIVANDTTPRFDLGNPDGSGKSFAPVDGTLGAISIKSFLDKDQLFDALHGIASIPPSNPSIMSTIMVKVEDYEEWPLKVIYAFDGLSSRTILDHLHDFYEDNPRVPKSRRPDFVHVAGKYVIVRPPQNMEIYDRNTRKSKAIDRNSLLVIEDEDADLQAIMWILQGLQEKASKSAHMLFSYVDLINYAMNVPPALTDRGRPDPESQGKS